MLEMRNRISSDRSSLLRTSAGLRGRDHQYQPQNKADEQQDLPEFSQIDVFITLAANQNHALPSRCWIPSHSPASDPPTTRISAPKSTFTPSR